VTITRFSRPRHKLLLLIFSTLFGLMAAWGVADWVRSRRSARDQSPYALSIVDQAGRRISAFDGPLRLVLDPFLVFRTAPHQKTGAFEVGPDGFRRTPSRPGRRAVVILGGSTTFGQPAPSDRETFCWMLGERLSRHQVVNAGVVGYLSGQELAMMTHTFAKGDVEAYVVVDGWNELYDQYLGHPRRPGQFGFNGAFFMIQDRLHAYFLHETGAGDETGPSAGEGKEAGHEDGARQARAAGAQETIAGEPVSNEPGAPAATEGEQVSKGPDPLPDADSDAYFHGLASAYEQNLLKMRDVARGRGSHFLVVFQPELGAKGTRTSAEEEALQAWNGHSGYLDRDFPGKYSRLVERAAAFCSDHDIPWLDARSHPALRDHPGSLFHDPVHLNEEGNRILAGLIEARLGEILSGGTTAGRQGPGAP
jgi:lysophospholipase L1-like esterase